MLKKSESIIVRFKFVRYNNNNFNNNYNNFNNYNNNNNNDNNNNAFILVDYHLYHDSNMTDTQVNTDWYISEGLQFNVLIQEDAKVKPFVDFRANKAAPSFQLFKDPEC